LSDATVSKFLRDFGLTRKEAEVYIFLAKRGALRSGEIVKGLKMHKGEVYRVLKSLQTKGLVESTIEFPTRFTAISFETALDSFIKVKREEAISAEKAKRELLEDWKSISKTGVELPLEKFVVIKGNRRIYPKILQMIEKTRNHFSAVSTVAGLLRADQFGLFDAIFKNPLKSKIKFRFITELYLQNLDAAKALLKRIPGTGFDFKGRNPDLGLQLSLRMVIRDQEEILLFITSKEASASGQNDVCLWTNCKALVDSFNAVFEDLWCNSTDLEEKIVEIETGRPTQNLHVFNDAETASKKYDMLLRSAEKEIVFVTSAEGLLAHRAEMERLEEWTAKGVFVRILAPITSKNLQAVYELSKCAAIRHLPDSFLETTVIDEKHLFQFKTQPTKEKKRSEWPYFENAFYTNDLEYVEKTKKMLNVFWQNARAPPTVTLESVMRPSPLKVAPISDKERPLNSYKKLIGFREEISEMLAAENILKKIIDAKKFPAENWPNGIMRYYGSCVMAIIHPAKQLNIPNTMIAAWHFDKQSSFGAEDTIRFFVWLETEKGHAYVPVALITDNPESAEFQKKITAGLPLARNVRVANKDGVQVRIHGNSGIAAWTVPVPLPPSDYVLPPACIMVEGCSTIKTISTKHVTPYGVNIIIQMNRYDGFVTLFHPSSKYTGSGTDGAVGRDVILTEYPPASR
jgi:sugar-specific transcriptional regulator TrmB